jgi:hypothetical protein
VGTHQPFAGTLVEVDLHTWGDRERRRRGGLLALRFRPTGWFGRSPGIAPDRSPPIVAITDETGTFTGIPCTWFGCATASPGNASQALHMGRQRVVTSVISNQSA